MIFLMVFISKHLQFKYVPSLETVSLAVRMEGTWEVAHFLHFAVSGLLVFVCV